jgi:hypothetical protein
MVERSLRVATREWVAVYASRTAAMPKPRQVVSRRRVLGTLGALSAGAAFG